MIIITTGFIPLSLFLFFFFFLKDGLWESSQWLEKNIVWNTGERASRKSMEGCSGHRDISEIKLKTALNPIKSVIKINPGKNLTGQILITSRLWQKQTWCWVGTLMHIFLLRSSLSTGQ